MESDLERGNGIGGDFGGRTIREEEISSVAITTVAVRPRGGGNGGGARRINRRSVGAGAGAGAGAGRGRQAQHIRRSRGQGWMNMLATHAVYLAANGLLYMLIQIKYQNQRKSPFETHPVVMTSSVVTFCVYLCATVLQAMLVQTNNELDDPKLLHDIIVCCGILSLISNALVLLFTHKVGWIVVAIIAFAASILLAYDLFMIISNYISERNNNNNNNNNNNATTASESLAMEMITGINNNVNNAATTTESVENSIAVNNNNSGTNNSNNIMP